MRMKFIFLAALASQNSSSPSPNTSFHFSAVKQNKLKLFFSGKKKRKKEMHNTSRNHGLHGLGSLHRLSTVDVTWVMPGSMGRTEEICGSGDHGGWWYFCN